MIQLQFINYVLDSKDAEIIISNNLDNSYFSAYKDEFNFIKSHLDKFGNIPDKTSFIEKFPSFDIIEVKESKDYLLKELFDDKKSRYLTESFNQIRTLLMDNKIENAESILNRINSDMPKYNCSKSTSIFKDTSRYETYLDKCNNYTKYYIKTGFPELDNITGGWDRKEELAVIVARPGVGKTTALLKSALTAAEQGLNVGLFEGEMQTDSVGYKIDTLISHISNGQIMHGNSNVQNDYKNHLLNISSKIKGDIKVLTPKDIGRTARVSDLRAFIERDKLDILFVDQYSLLDDERKARSTPEKIANISSELKNLQVMYQLPIISVSQQNREKDEDGVSLNQIAQSDRIGQDATTVLFLEQKDGVLTMHLVKARYSGKGGKALRYNVDYDKGLYINIPDEETSTEEDLEELKNSYEVETPTPEETPF